MNYKKKLKIKQLFYKMLGCLRRNLSTKCVNKNQEIQYLNLVRDILNNGEIIESRNGITKNKFGISMKFDLDNNTLPMLTSKKMAWKTCLKELLWFISGSTDNHLLKMKNVNIWNETGTREFLNNRGLVDYMTDDLGPIYGHQWRHWNAKYFNCFKNYDNRGIDQLQHIIDSLKDEEKRYSRRLILSAWNPEQLDEMALPPCHILSQFYVNNKDELSCALYQRSGDVGLGVPFNILSYSFLTHILAEHCGLKAKSFHHFIGVAHIYEEHQNELAKQLNNKIYEFPKIKIRKRNYIDDYNLGDIKVENYKYSKSVNMKLIA